ncbi:adenine phosphoribosyltransferase 1-like isoform X2 [Typha latifolia]|uniref:adenine phosphoribosyltransferase 1-like isoform X2 n=1 Tax=Typha latifolia TaxID=4733 RepID=UPI003C2B5BB5
MESYFPPLSSSRPLFIHATLPHFSSPLLSTSSLSVSPLLHLEIEIEREKAMSVCEEKKEEMKDDRMEGIASSIRVVPNFPKPGIMFQDITTLLLDPKAFKDAVDLFVERYTGRDVSVVAGIEARGFIFGPPIALAIGAKFIPLRKPRKLPGEVISEEYVLEYGTDCLEMHVGAVQPGERALVVDDLIATGGTLCAAINLLAHVAICRTRRRRSGRMCMCH